MYKCLLFKDVFNYVGIVSNGVESFDDFRVDV